MSETPIILPIPELLVEQIAERAAELVIRSLDLAQGLVPPFLTVNEAAAYLRCKRQRIYDLLSAGRLTRHRDGRRVLIARAELDSYLAGSRPNRVVPVLSPTGRSDLGKGLGA